MDIRRIKILASAGEQSIMRAASVSSKAAIGIDRIAHLYGSQSLGMTIAEEGHRPVAVARIRGAPMFGRSIGVIAKIG